MNRARLKDEIAYWSVLCDLFGWTLYGWTLKVSATFICAGETIQISGRQRDVMVDFAAARA